MTCIDSFHVIARFGLGGKCQNKANVVFIYIYFVCVCIYINVGIYTDVYKCMHIFLLCWKLSVMITVFKGRALTITKS